MVQKRGVPEDELPRLKDGTPLEYRFPFTMVRHEKIDHGERDVLPFMASMRLHLFHMLKPFDMSTLIIYGGNVPRAVRNDVQVDVVRGGRIAPARSNKDYVMMDLIPHYDVILGTPGKLSSRVFAHAQRHRTLICDYTTLVFHNDVWQSDRPVTTLSHRTPLTVQVLYSKKASGAATTSLIGHRNLLRTYDRVTEFLNNPDFLEYY